MTAYEQFNFFKKKVCAVIALIVTTSIFQSQTVLGLHNFKSGTQTWVSGESDVAIPDTAFSYSVTYSFYLKYNSENASSMDRLDTFMSTDPIENLYKDIIDYGFGAYIAQFNNELNTYYIDTINL